MPGAMPGAMYAALVVSLAPLPIDAWTDAVCAEMARHNLVLVAEPGAGKTTRIPVALERAGCAGMIVVVEPRRLAARLAAERIASELGENVGQKVGYQVRFDNKRSSNTRILFMTEGLLARRIAGDPTLADVGVVLLDEFHERNLTGDLTLALVRRAQLGPRPDLRIGVMSATMEPAPVAEFLGQCPVVHCQGRTHPVSVEFDALPSRDPVERQVARALGRVARERTGDVLVFLPGAAEIHRSMRACAELADRMNLELAPLYGSLPAAEQQRALLPSSRRKVIFATNVAETSLTIEGVAIVIDAGTARVSRYSPWTGLPSLRIEPVSQASSTQRAGRAGRTGPGHCVRLYTQHDHDGRRAFEVPEIERSDLSDALLALRTAGVAAGEDVWFQSPPTAAIEAAEATLGRLGALDDQGLVTAIGRRLAQLPVHPRLARVAIEAERRGARTQGCLMASILAELHSAPWSDRPASHGSDSDILDLVDDCQRGGHGWSGRSSIKTIRTLARTLERAVGLAGHRSLAPPTEQPLDRDEALAMSLLAGFCDRVARRRRPGSPQLLLCDGAGGGQAELHRASAVQGAEFVVAVDVEERGRGADRQVVVRRAQAIDPLWLLEFDADGFEESDQHLFDPACERVERIGRTRYDGLIIDETRRREPSAVDRDAAGAQLEPAARAAGFAHFVNPQELEALRGRVAFAVKAAPGAGLEALTDQILDELLGQVARSCVSFAEIRQQALLDQLLDGLGPDARRTLDRLAPTSLSLPGRKRVPVHYPGDRPPWIESRMQDFFGLERGPRVAGGQVAVVMHLQAPNRRAVQVTDDLARFWKVHYPDLRKQLSRRYPRHSWPDDPTATCPRGGRTRSG